MLLFSCAGDKPGSTASAPASPAAADAQPPATGSSKPRPRDLETFMALIDMGIYKSKVAPAFEKYVTTGDSSALRALLPADAPNNPGLPEVDDRRKRLAAALAAASRIVEAKCLVRLAGIEPFQLGGSTALVSYLYSASDWLRETLTAKDISDITLDYPIGEHTEIIRPTDAAEIRVYTRNIPVPEDAAIKTQLAALLKMMETAEKNPNYALALVMK